MAPNSGHVVMTSSGVRARMNPVAERLLASPASAGVPVRHLAPGTAPGAQPAWSRLGCCVRRLRPTPRGTRQFGFGHDGLRKPKNRQVGRTAGAFGAHSGQRQTRGPRTPLGLIPGCSLRALWARCWAHPAHHVELRLGGHWRLTIVQPPPSLIGGNPIVLGHCGRPTGYRRAPGG